MAKVNLTAEDKKLFKDNIRTANPIELLTVADFVEAVKEDFTAADLKFLHTHIGMRCERLLKNVVQNLSFEDRRT
jgi:hypothetical protein